MENPEAKSGRSEVVVVGAGLAGLSVAHELARRGRRVCVIDAAEDVAMGASFANGGLLTPSMSDPWNSPGVHRHLFASLFDPHSAMKLRPSAIPSLMFWGVRFLANSRPADHRRSTIAVYSLAAYSLAAMHELREGLGLAFDSASRGSLKLFRSQAAIEACLPVNRLLEEQGMKLELLDRRATFEAEPQLSPIGDEVAGAILYPGDACGDARLYCQALQAEIERQGGEIRLGTTVTRVMRSAGAVEGVATSRGRVFAPAVVVAAATASDRLTREHGVRLGIRPAKGYSLTVEGGDGPIPAMPVVDDALHAAITPLGSRLRIAGTAEFAGEDKRIDRARIENLVGLLGAVYPEIRARIRMEEAVPWCGLRPMTADGLPYVGPAPLKGLWVNAGHGHLGFTLAAGSARMLADLMDGRQPEIDPAPFAVLR
jgi:D-amino-acid dehydrogenase